MSETIQELMDNENEEEDDEEDESYEEDEDEEDEDEDDDDEDDDDSGDEDDVPIEEDLSAPLFAAIFTGEITVVKSVPGVLDLLQRTNFGSTPLYIAARDGHLDIVRYFVDQGEIHPTVCSMSSIIRPYNAIAMLSIQHYDQWHTRILSTIQTCLPMIHLRCLRGCCELRRPESPARRCKARPSAGGAVPGRTR